MQVDILVLEMKILIKCWKVVNCKDLDELIKKTVPDHILFKDKLKLRPGMSEEFNKVNMQLLSLKNKFKKTYIGLGYHNTSYSKCNS